MRIRDKFDSLETGFAKWLPASEAALFEYLLQHPQGVTVREAHRDLEETQRLQYNTIGGHLTSLCRRGFAAREDFSRNSSPQYRPIVTRGEALAVLIHKTLVPLLRDHPRETFRELKTFLPHREKREGPPLVDT